MTKKNSLNMQHEDFSRYLREKYSTRLHIADQLIDQLKQNKRSSVLTNEFNKKKVLKPYFNECILAAERIKNNRRSERDRQICYENLILAEKLERIKTNQNLENHSRLLTSKVNYEEEAIKSIHKKFMAQQSLLSNEKRLVGTVISSYHSPSPSQSETSLSENEDDQATAADVDASIEYCNSTLSVSHREMSRNHATSISKKYNFKNQNQKFFETENNCIYQHLNNIDMTMFRDTIPLSRPETSKHFSICILPHFDSDRMKSLSNNRQCAFKKEILYH